ncbi:MAG: 5-deoxy-glucuronate isomerase [Rhizobiales bacterium]|nr:5-deoxy-glucuronate isomerase [Hyphomicrobiales bacterium]NRB13192.1 5-deoxy-glucuronate isomerase [Hyphomicrobiales bacterium]
MHIPPFDNSNKPLVDIGNSLTPYTYFNIVKLKQGQAFTYQTPGYETCIAPATGCVNVEVEGQHYASIGKRTLNVWDGEPEAVYVPSGAKAEFVCVSDEAEIFIAGAKFAKTLDPFAVRADDIEMIQYGSDDTKTHRKIKHILGTKYHDKVGRLLVSELYTVGAGGWSGFPSHKHDTDRLPNETCHNEVYNFRFKPDHGFGMQLLQPEAAEIGEAFHIIDGSTFAFNSGYHPCVAAPGYEMYYFTILGGKSQRSLVQFFQPEHAYQVETIPGIKDMIAKFK